MKVRLKSIFTLLFFLMAFWAVSQPGGGRPPGGGGPPCSNPPCNPVPITGIEWILGAGALFGASKLRKRKS